LNSWRSIWFNYCVWRLHIQ